MTNETSKAIFQPKKSRMARYARYAGLVEVISKKTDGKILVTQTGEWNPFSALASELTYTKMHGSQYTLNNDGTLRTYGNDDSK